jgi:hypothetical protein
MVCKNLPLLPFLHDHCHPLVHIVHYHAQVIANLQHRPYKFKPLAQFAIHRAEAVFDQLGQRLLGL